MQRKLLAIVVALGLATTFAVPIAMATSSSPGACTPYQTTSNTSSDGSMYVKAIAYLCPGGGTSGQIGWDAYSGGSYTTTSVNYCNSAHTVPSSDNIVVGQFYYGTSGCSYYVSGNYAFNTLFFTNTGTASGFSTTDVLGWSGNCAWGGSACTATASASA